MQYLDAISKTTKWSLFICKANHSISQLSKSMPQPVTLTRPFRTNTQKRCPFQYRGLECKSRKSRNTWGNRQIGMQNEAGQRLIEFCQENALVIANTLFQQHKRRLYTWTSPDGQHWNQTDHILCSQQWRSSIQSAKTRLGADCGSDHELLLAQFRLKLKKIGKTTRPLRYDLDQIPYDYTVEGESCSVVSDCLRPRGLCSPWNSLGQNPGVGSCSLLQGIFPTQVSRIAGGFFTIWATRKVPKNVFLKHEQTWTDSRK